MSTDYSGSAAIQSNSIAGQQEQKEPPRQKQSQEDENRRILQQQNNMTSSTSLPLSRQSPPLEENSAFAEIIMNRALYDPPRWGWTALGGIADVLSPHERSRRHSTCRAYKKRMKRARRITGMISGGGTKGGATVSETTAAQLKDPPSYPRTSTVLPIVSSEENKNQSTSSSQPTSLATPTVSPSEHQNQTENQKQPEQNGCTNESNCEPEITKGSADTITPKPTARIEGCRTGEGNDVPKRQNRASEDDENKGKTPNPLDDSDPTVPREDEPKKTLDASCTLSDKTIVLPKEQPPEIDVGIETVGISTNLLGMTIERQGQPQSTTEANNDNNDHEDGGRNTEGKGRKNRKHGKNRSRRSGGGVVLPRMKYDCHVRSLGIASSTPSKSAAMDIDESKMILDMYAYHQGREGMEARDADTGELLFTQQATDTNHDFDAPKSTFSIEIEFPLEDDDGEVDGDDFDCGHDDNRTKKLESENKYYQNDKRNPRSSCINQSGEDNNTTTTAAESTGGSLKKKELAMYRQTITWDLLDPNTPTPLSYAASIGKEYGLSFGQTMDLAARIDKQIEKHVTDTSHYREPIATRENIQEVTQPRKIGPIRQPYRYDEIIQTEKEGGTFKPKREGRGQPKHRPVAAAGASKHKRDAGSLGRGKPKNNEPKNNGSAAKNNGSTARKDGSAAPDKSEVSLEDELVDELLDEVRKRSTAESVIDVRQNSNKEPAGVLILEKNSICHICKKRAAVGFHFPCSMNNHVYCELHVTRRLGITKESGVYNHSSCPICSLTCECAKCVRKLKNVATILKAKCIEQRKQPNEVDFPNILSSCKNAIPNKELNRAADLVLEKRREQIRRRREEVERKTQQESEGKSLDKAPKCLDKAHVKSRTIQLAGQTMVPRPPLSDFPREICNGSDFDSKSTDAYFTVYSAEGKRSVSDVPEAWLDDDDKGTKPGLESSDLTKIKDNSDVPEDGNVDYCHICKTAGHLILCDFCPRGFHQDCLRQDIQSCPEGDQWECFVCKNEKAGSDNDYVDGKQSMGIISRAFLELDANDERAIVGLEVLSIIHQMLTNLVNYDFGSTFSKPVDTLLVPGYTDIVKRPMDISTICSKLANGDFAKLLNGKCSMDDLVTKVLNDIELIWRNCIMFNVIGSSVARMALVLRRRVRMICRRSIFCKLSDTVKKNVSNYARQFDEAWASGITTSFSEEKGNSVSTDSWKLTAIANLKPRSHLKFNMVKAANPRSIAILDSVSGRIVKLYSSVKSASEAVKMILKSGHRCEWNASASRTDLNLKLIAEKSRNDPNSLLFGYRWLFLDDLNEGKVTFLKTVCDFVEMRHDQFTFVFQSIEEALSSFHLSKTVDIDGLRKKLFELPRTGNWTEIDGVHWRRPMIREQRQDSVKMEDSTISAKEDLRLGVNLVPDGDNLLSWKNCVFLKKDLVTGQNLVGFDSIQLAHQDWMQSALSSPCFPDSEARTMENFKKYYLDGDRNVDGMVWVTVEDRNKVEEEKKETTRNENLVDGMEIQDSEDSQNISSELTGRGENSMIPKSGESKPDSSMNESSSCHAMAMANDQQQVVLEHPSATMTLEKSPGISSRKRKYLDNEMDFPAGKEARLSVVTVE